MRKKLIAVFLILSLLPIGLLLWLGVMSVKSEADRNRRQNEALAEERLFAVSQRIENIVLGLESRVAGLKETRTMEVEDIRDVIRRTGLIRQIFIMAGDGTMRYPSEEGPLSSSELDFLNRIRELGLSPGSFLFSTGAEEESGHKGPSAGPEKSPSPETPGHAQTGWYTWYYGEGLNFLYWLRLGDEDSRDEEIVGVELNRTAVISALISGLPDTEALTPDSPARGPDAADGTKTKAGRELFRIRLTDLDGSVVYQWGSYTPKEDGMSVVSLPAPPPLSSWRLEYFAGPDSARPPAGRVVSLFAPLAAVMIALTGLSLYLYRESTREVREAMRRVTFVNQVSHELKTPLTNIRMYAEMLEAGMPEEDAKNRRYAEVVASESRRLSRLIANVLTFAKESRTGLTLNVTACVPDEVMADVIAGFKPSLKERKMKLSADLRVPDTVMLDRDILEQIAVNLMSNAEKYAASGGYLRIETALAGNQFALTVGDRGPGIPQVFRERVFKPFFRLSNKITDGVSGTGIGLSIVRNLARLHGGDALILSSDDGTTFKVTLRVSSAGEKPGAGDVGDGGKPAAGDSVGGTDGGKTVGGKGGESL